MHYLGVIKVFVFFSAWVGSILLIPLAIFLSYLLQSPVPVTIVFGYYLFRQIFPSKKWDFFRLLLDVEKTPYTNSSKIVFEEGAEPPKPNSKVFIAMAPHGILTMGWGAMIASNHYTYSNFRWLVAPIMCKILPIADIMGWSNSSPADAKSMQNYMKNGENVGLLPGGFQEATLYKYGKFRIFIKERKGFIKYALQHGYSMQVVFCFGEELLFHTHDILPLSWTLWLNKHQIPCLFFWGKFFFMPFFDLDMTSVVAKPLPFPTIPNPTQEQIDEYHAKVIQAFQDLFDRNKGKYAASGEKATLEIF